MVSVSMKVIWISFLLIFLMTACGEQSDEVAEAVELEALEQERNADPSEVDETRDLAEMAHTDPEGLREALRDPERRQAVIEAMREQRGERELEPEQLQQRELMRERMRERREEMMAGRADMEPGEDMRRARPGARGPWWEDDNITQSLALSETQAEHLGQAHQTLNELRRESRKSMAHSQRQLHQALQAVDREKIQQLLEQRQAAAVALAQAESDWFNTLLHELSDEQIRTLAEEHPGALARGR